MRFAWFAVAAGILFVAAPARADYPPWLEDGKAGRFMLNLHLGAAFPLHNDVTAGVAQLQIGMAINDDRTAYVYIPLEATLSGSASTFLIGLGLEYDIRLPVPGLYICPRLAAGYAAILPYDAGDVLTPTDRISAGFVLPEIAVKLVVKKRWNLGVVPFSIPVYFTLMDDGTGTGTTETVTRVAYRVEVFAGVNF
jgi:hypothetical protein